MHVNMFVNCICIMFLQIVFELELAIYRVTLQKLEELNITTTTTTTTFYLTYMMYKNYLFFADN